MFIDIHIYTHIFNINADLHKNISISTQRELHCYALEVTSDIIALGQHQIEVAEYLNY